MAGFRLNLPGPGPYTQQHESAPEVVATPAVLTIGVAYPGHTNQGLVNTPVPSGDFGPLVELGPRFFRPAASHTSSATASYLFDVATAGTASATPRLTVALQGQTNQGGVIRPVPPPQDPPERSTVPIIFEALTPAPFAGAPPATILVPGSSTLGSGTLTTLKGVPAFDRLEPKDPVPQWFNYYNAAPPIYKVITPGSTNQHYTFRAYLPHSPVQNELGSRLFRASAAAGGTVFGSATASYIYGVSTNGVRTAFGTATAAYIFNVATNGVRTRLGSATAAYVFNVATAGTSARTSSATASYVFNAATAGVPKHFGTTTAGYLFNVATAGTGGTAVSTRRRLRQDKEDLPKEPWPRPRTLDRPDVRNPNWRNTK